MKQRSVVVLMVLILFSLLLSCITTSPPRSPQDGFEITGFVGKSPVIPAPNETVMLLDGAGARRLNSVVTNFFGKYTFGHLPPGEYILMIGEIKKQVYVQDRDVRLDIDLSAPGGGMDYMTYHAKEAQKEAIRVRYNNGSETILQYRQSGKSGCLLFNGNTLCRTSASCN